jgi:hypothetical protein
MKDEPQGESRSNVVLTLEQLLANMQRIAAKMDADMRTISSFMKLAKMKFDLLEARLAALESRMKDSPGAPAPVVEAPPRIPRPAEATITLAPSVVDDGGVTDAMFTEDEGA